MENVLAIREAYRLNDWAQIIREQQSSGLTKREFCRQSGITERKFYYWLNKVRQALIETTDPQLVAIETQSVGVSRGIIRIEWGSTKLELPGAVDMEAVASVLKSLQAIKYD